MAVLFLLPALLGLALFFYYPIGQTMLFSLFDLERTTQLSAERFVGVQNYATVLQTTQFWQSFGYTLYFTVVSVFLEFWIGMGMALATFWVVPQLRGLLRAIIIIPWAIPAIIQASIWRWLFHSDVGLIGDVLVRLGIVAETPLFLSSPLLAMHSIILAYVWRGAAVTSIFLMGGLAMVPRHLHDAAMVDGAPPLMHFWRITLPLLLPTILVTLMFRTIDALRAFEIVYGLTGGGPGTTTEVLSSFAYRYYFSYLDYGQGAAYAVVSFVLVMGVSWLYIRRIVPHLQFRG
ncbi:MAG: sugar ABC transporter permease [Chloroflexaceae bacterium]|nr:sugar ABC transporter permease [Chloroflexaceae bacterium]NJO04430.1 sugar ABC transporter permease [Chloroflexaceae bacterium]